MFTKLSFSILFLFLSISCFSQITVLSNGNVGIGNNSSPTYKLDVDGTARINGWTDLFIDWSGLCSGVTLYPESDWYMQLGKSGKRIGTIFVSGIHYNALWGDSDEKLKENIDSLQNPLPKLMRLRGYHYNFKESLVKEMPQSTRALFTKKTLGYKAQELEKEFPELVYRPDSVRSSYAINYIGMIPILSECLKYQQKQIESLQKFLLLQEQDIIELKKQIETLKSKNGSKTKSTNIENLDLFSDNSNEIRLYQNTPNPFNKSSEIKYYIPESINSASIYIFNMQGTMIRNISITNKGNGSIIINGSELSAGMYLYTLVADGNEVETKRMILTK